MGDNIHELEANESVFYSDRYNTWLLSSSICDDKFYGFAMSSPINTVSVGISGEKVVCLSLIVRIGDKSLLVGGSVTSYFEEIRDKLTQEFGAPTRGDSAYNIWYDGRRRIILSLVPVDSPFAQVLFRGDAESMKEILGSSDFMFPND